MQEYVRKTLRLLNLFSSEEACLSTWIFLPDGPEDVFHTIQLELLYLLQLLSQLPFWETLLPKPNQVVLRQFR